MIMANFCALLQQEFRSLQANVLRFDFQGFP